MQGAVKDPREQQRERGANAAALPLLAQDLNINAVQIGNAPAGAQRQPGAVCNCVTCREYREREAQLMEQLRLDHERLEADRQARRRASDLNKEAEVARARAQQQEAQGQAAVREEAQQQEAQRAEAQRQTAAREEAQQQEAQRQAAARAQAQRQEAQHEEALAVVALPPGVDAALQAARDALTKLEEEERLQELASQHRRAQQADEQAGTPETPQGGRTCAICLCGIWGEHHRLCAAPCGHMFHSTCLLQCVIKQPECPVCRASCNPTQISHLF